MNKFSCYSAVVATSLSLSLMACSAPTLKPENAPLGTQPLQQHALPASWTTNDQGFGDEYQFALLSAPGFNIQTYLDAVKSKGKLTLINGIVNPVELTLPANLKNGEYFPLLANLSKAGEFEVRLHPTQAHTLNIKPLKPRASALLTLVAGSERVVLELETLANIPSDTQYLSALKDKPSLSLINGMVNTIDLTAAENLKQGEVYSLLTRLSKAGEFDVKPHPTNAAQITVKPLKSGARANLTLIAGKQRVEVALETIDSGKLTLGDNLTLVFPENLTLKKDEVREISVNGIAQGQFVFIGYKNSNPQGFRVETPKDKPNVVRVTALQDESTTDVTVLIGQTTRTLTFTSSSLVQDTAQPLITINSPVTGTSFNNNDDIKLVAQIQNPDIGSCTTEFKDEAGNILPTSKIDSETTATQVTHLWKSSDRATELANINLQAVYTCSNSQTEVKSNLTEVTFNPLVKPLPQTQSLTLKATPVVGQEFTQMLLEFAPLPDILDYKVYANERLLGSLTTQPADKIASYKAEGLSPGTDYVFKIEAIQNGLASTSGMAKASTNQVTSSGGGNFTPSTPVAATTPTVATPTVTSISPTSSTVSGSITITGTGFDAATGNNTVKFGATTATVTAASTTSLTVTVPTLTTGTYNVTVTVGGQTNTGTNNFTAQNWAVTTIVGSTTSGSTDAVGTAASFNAPVGLVRDTAGNMYVTEGSGHRIRKIDTGLNVTTIAGNGTSGFSNGAGTAATFNSLQGIARDSAGNLYVSDMQNHSIRKIDTAGNVTTLAGTGTSGFSDGVASAAQFNQPVGVNVDSAGNVYVADSGNDRVRKIDTAGNVTTFIGGTNGSADGVGTAAQCNAPYGFVRDNAGNLYLTQTGATQRIRKIASDGTVTTLAGNANGSADGVGSAAQFTQPRNMVLDSAGNLYVTDTNSQKIRKMDSGLNVMTIVGSGSFGFSDGTASAAQFKNPMGIEIDSAGSLYVVDGTNNVIRKITP